MTTITELFLAIWNYANPVIYGVILGFFVMFYRLPKTFGDVNYTGFVIVVISFLSSSFLNNVDKEREFAIVDKKYPSEKLSLQLEGGTYITGLFREVYYFSTEGKKFCLLDPDSYLSIRGTGQYKEVCYKARISDPVKFAEKLSSLDKFSKDNTRALTNTRKVLDTYFHSNGFPDHLPDFVEFKLVETGK